jgi:hypothetical protein
MLSPHAPAIWPVLLIASATQPFGPVKPGAGRPVMVPLLYRKACPGLLPYWPTTCPESLIPFAPLSDPARGFSPPRSIIFCPFHRNASLPPLLVDDPPATHPDLLIALPTLKSPPPTVPRSVIWPLP